MQKYYKFEASVLTINAIIIYTRPNQFKMGHAIAVVSRVHYGQIGL